jgi:hypothetical protein
MEVLAEALVQAAVRVVLLVLELGLPVVQVAAAMVASVAVAAVRVDILLLVESEVPAAAV